MSEGTVLHADLDSFFASVEVRDDPRLRGRPVIVGGGVVLAATYQARACGVRTAMGGRQALRLCPDAIVVPPRFDAYVAASRAVFEVFADTTPLVEAMSIDEAFLEVGGLRRLRGAPSTIAAQLREDVTERVGLPISVGVARTKYLAKVASAMSKPDGLLVVPLEDELRFLHALPVERLWGVGKVTSAKLHDARIHTVAQVAALEEGEVMAVVGRAAGRHLWSLAQGRDPRPVERRAANRSMGAQAAVGRGPHTRRDAEAVLLRLVDRVSRRMRSHDRTGRTVTLRIRFADFTASTSSHTLTRATSHTDTLTDVARRLLDARWPEISVRGLTLVGVSVSGLDDHGEQLLLPLEEVTPPSLDATLDALRDRFGSPAVRRAVHLSGPRREARSPLAASE